MLKAAMQNYRKYNTVLITLCYNCHYYYNNIIIAITCID